MKRRALRLLALALTLALLISALPGPALAAEGVSRVGDLTIGPVTFAGRDENDLTDSFVYAEKWFSDSAMNENRHLATLSMTVAMASAPGENWESPVGNLQKLLEDMGFTDVAANRYYADGVTLENSMGCAAGYKTLEGEDCTLIALVPRSGGYLYEWVGNMTLGEEGIHAGFRAARDECLRFLRAYLADNQISGRVKLWIPGYSRGGAVANLLGGFLCDAGESYLAAGGVSVTLAPEDLYVYTFSAPAVLPYDPEMVEAVTVAEATAVSAGDEELLETPGEAFPGLADDRVVDPWDYHYGGIYNYFHDSDLVSMVPFRLWHFTRFGRSSGVELEYLNDPERKDAMLTYLREIDPETREAYTGGESPMDPDLFHIKAFRLLDGSVVDKPTAPETTQREFMQGRMDYVVEHVLVSRGDFAAKPAPGQSYQNMFRAFAELAVVNPEARDALLEGIMGNTMGLIADLTLIYADYVANWKDSGIFTTEGLQDPEIHSQAVEQVEALLQRGIDNMEPEDQAYYGLTLPPCAEAMEVLLTAVLFGGTGDSVLTQDTLATFFGNAGGYVGAHVGSVNLSWLRTMDSFYFTDVPRGEWYSDPVIWAVDEDVTQGMGRGIFQPDGTCTRAQMATFLWRQAGSPEPALQENPFTDVDSTAYYETAVRWAVEAGITKGTSATTFAPKEECTRAQTVTFMSRAFG